MNRISLVLGILGAIIICGDGCVMRGTHFDAQTLTQKDVQGMSVEQCDLILEENTSTNIFWFNHEVEVFVSPCTPRMLLAYNWKKRQQHHISTEEFFESMDRQARGCLGASFDRAGWKFLDLHGSVINDISQVDSMLFLVSFGTSTYFAKRLDLSRLVYNMYLSEHDHIVSEPYYVKMNGDYLQRGLERECDAMFPVTNRMKEYMATHETLDLCINLDQASVRIPVRFVF